MSKLKLILVLFPGTLMAMAKRVFFVFTVLTILASVYSITRANAQYVQAATPATLNFQARLMTSSGNLVPDGNYNIEFKLYNASTSTGSSQGNCTGDANCLWAETRTGGNQVQVKNGYLSAYLGDISALPSNIWDQQLWLTMNIGGVGTPTWDGEMTPRIRMTSVPYAFQAKSAATLNKNTGSFSGTVDFATLTADRRYLFPDTSLATTASPGIICVYNGAASNCPAASGSAYYIQNDTVVQTQSNFNMQARDNGLNGTIVGQFRGASAGQTVDLVQFQASDGSVLAAVTSAGNLQVASSVDTRSAGTLNVGASTATAVSIGKAGAITTVNGELTVAEALSANGGASITGITDINTTGSAITTIGNASAGIVLDAVVTVNQDATFNENVIVATGKTIQLVGGATSTRPASPSEGMMYFDTGTKQLLVFANGKWQADGKDAIIVAANDSSQREKDAADYVADGTADQMEINQALTAAAGKKVVLLAGTYVANGTILVPNNTTLSGIGTGTVIELADIDAAESLIENSDTTTGTGITIRDLRIDGRKDLNTAGAQSGIVFTGMGAGAGSSARKGGLITGVTASNFRNVGIILYSSPNNIISNNYLNNNDVNAIGLDGTSHYNVISGNIAQGSSYGIVVGSAGNAVTGNVVEGHTNGGMYFAAATGNTISGNAVSGNGASGIMLVTNSHNNTISDNRVVDSGASTTNNGIFVSDSDHNSIIGNHISDASATLNNFAITIFDASSDNNYLANNVLGGATIADAGTGTIYAGQVDDSGNYVIQPASGSSIELMRNTNVTGNLSVTGTTTTRGLTVNTASATDDQIVISVTSGGAGRFDGNITNADLTTARTWTLPNASGTFITTGNLADITAVGTIGSGTWQGTSIADAYIDDNISISSSGSVDWSALNNYPAACAAGSAISELGDTVTCTSFASGSAADYIQNQNSGAQATSDYWITGTGRADTSMLAPAFDIGTAATLNVGTTNATLINIGKAGVTTAILGALTVDEGVMLSSTLDVTGNATFTTLSASGAITSTVATGTAPLTVASTTVVANLNADQLDGQSGAFYQDASNLTAGNLDAARLSGNYTGISGVGTLNVGAWNASSIADAYIDDNISISSSGSVDWSALNNYPAACGAGQAIIQLDDTVTCSSFATGSAGDYIQNQNSAQQATSNYWISGSGRADTSFLAPIFDAAVAGTLGIGTTSATLINVGQTGVSTNVKGSLTVDQNFTVGGGGNVAFQRNTTSYTAVGIQDDVNFGTGVLFRIASASALTVNGIAGGADGRIITLMNASGVNVTLGNNASATAANSIVTGTGSALVIPAGSSAQLAYDSGSNAWRVIGGTATAGGTANQQLSNLSGTVAVNASLVPDADNTLNLGSAANSWASLYADTSVLTPSVDTASATTISIGTVNASAVSIARTGVTTTVNGALTVTQATQLNGGLTVGGGGNVAFQRGADYANTGVQNDINFGTGALIRITSASALTITSIAGGVDGRVITLVNASANAITINNESGGVATNQIITGTGSAVSLPAGASITLAYDSSSSRWRVIGSTAAAGGYIQLQSGTPGTAQTGNFNINGTGIAATSLLTPTLDTPSGITVLNIGTTNATAGINLNQNTQVTGNVTLAQGASRTLGVQTRTTNAVGNDLTVSAGSAGAGASAFGGGNLNLQGGSAAGTGNANGGSVTIAGGAGVGTGSQGLVNLSTTAFTSSAVQTFNATGVNTLASSLVNNYSTIPVLATTVTGIVVSVPDPSQNTVVGRVLYITARDASLDFTLRLNASGTAIDIAMKKNSTATLIWNGDKWTAAGASNSTDLQSAYNNTLTSAGGAEIILNPTGGAADGFTIRNNATTPINGGLLEVQSSVGTNLFSVNNRGTELAANGGSETSSTFATNWTSAPVGGTVTRTINSSQYVTGQAGVQVATTAASHGVRNNLASNPVINTTYTVSFTIKSSVAITGDQLSVLYSRDGGTNLQSCSSYSTRNVSATTWTKITCTITTDSTTATNPDLIIRQGDSTARNIWIDNLSFVQNDSTTEPSNVQIGGGINGGPVTLFTLDRSTSPPVAAGNDTYLGSMYYDITTGRIQCYEADGWGACGSAPDNIVTLTPEYTGAVLNGNGIGVMTADICANQASVLVVGTLCASGEARNFYRWTSPQATLQDYSIYVTYKLPSTFKQFADNNTMKLTAYRDDPDNTDALVKMATYRKSSSGGLTLCGTETNITQSSAAWEQRSVDGSENSCGFVGDDYIIFKITMSSRNNTNVYVENLDFTYSNK